MGCKHSKSAVRDESAYVRRDHYKGEDPTDINAMMYGRNDIETQIIDTHQVGAFDDNGSRQLAPQAEPMGHGYCQSDYQYTKMAESCTAGILEMFQFNNNDKMITNGPPPMVSAYQHPAYNYEKDSNSIKNRSQTSSQRRASMVRTGSFQL